MVTASEDDENVLYDVKVFNENYKPSKIIGAKGVNGRKTEKNFWIQVSPDTYSISLSILKDKEVTKFLKSTQTIKILLAKPSYKTKLEYDDRIDLPLRINELNKKIIELNVKKKIFQNLNIK